MALLHFDPAGGNAHFEALGIVMISIAAIATAPQIIRLGILLVEGTK
jgi:hypothetical protein